MNAAFKVPQAITNISRKSVSPASDLDAPLSSGMFVNLPSSSDIAGMIDCECTVQSIMAMPTATLTLS